MQAWFAAHAIGSLWNIIWHLGGIALVMIAALAVAYFAPTPKLKGIALWIAAGAAFVLGTATYYTNKGASYEKAKYAAVARQVHTKVDDAVKRATDPAAGGVPDRWDSDTN